MHNAIDTVINAGQLGNFVQQMVLALKVQMVKSQVRKRQV